MIGRNVPHKRALPGRGSSPQRKLARLHSGKLKPFPGATCPVSRRIIAVRFVQFRTSKQSISSGSRSSIRRYSSKSRSAIHEFDGVGPGEAVAHD
jgi:hypothetical protein